jgi:hypothetical protein
MFRSAIGDDVQRLRAVFNGGHTMCAERTVQGWCVGFPCLSGSRTGCKAGRARERACCPSWTTSGPYMVRGRCVRSPDELVE